MPLLPLSWACLPFLDIRRSAQQKLAVTGKHCSIRSWPCPSPPSTAGCVPHHPWQGTVSLALAHQHCRDIPAISSSDAALCTSGHDLCALHDLANVLRLLDSLLGLLDNNRSRFRTALEEFTLLLPAESATPASPPAWPAYVAAYPFLASFAPFDSHLGHVIAAQSHLRQAISRTAPPEISAVDPLTAALQCDDAAAFSLLLVEAQKAGHPALSWLVSRALLERAPACIAALAKSDTFDPAEPLAVDVYGGNALHRIARGVHDRLSGPPTSPSSQSLVDRDADNLRIILANGHSQKALVSRDSLGRLPLHMAAHLGRHSLADIILSASQEAALSAISTRDDLGQTPLDLAVASGHHATVQTLLSWISANTSGSLPFSSSDLGDLARQCCLMGHDLALSVLLGVPAIDLNAKDNTGETVAHVAARYNRVAAIDVLSKSAHALDWNAVNKAGQSPLIIAAAGGHKGFVERLLDYPHINVNIKDRCGLAAHEAAVLHGEIAVADVLSKRLSAPYPPIPAVPFPDQDRVVDRGFGQDGILTDDTIVQIYLGSFDSRETRPPVDIGDAFMNTVGCAPLLLKVWVDQASPADTEERACSVLLHNGRLPTRTSPITSPFVFRTKNPSCAVIHFEIWPIVDASSNTALGSDGQTAAQSSPIAAAQALITSAKFPLWKDAGESCGRFVLPIIATSNTHQPGSAVGTILAEIVQVMPAHPGTVAATPRGGRWHSSATKVIGHRGLGANRPPANGRSYLQLGENTVMSLTKAGELGAEYVEFDVQLTKDGVPVIYHNFVTTEAGPVVAVNHLTLSEFLNLHDKARHPPKRAQSPDGRRIPVHPHLLTPQGKMRANSDGSVQAPFPSFDDLFKHVPASTGFNIEIKYPSLQEAETLQISLADINYYCDRILSTAFKYAHVPRAIYFSSFHPEICLLLTQKQNKYPVFFLTQGGMAKDYDARLNSLWSAILVAKRTGCLGIVTLVDPLLLAPRIQYCGQLQDPARVWCDGIIVDKVRTIAVGLSQP
ncbi:Glycerophosphoryl diester phosphodiesterase family-domain-containing protein [Entophlyctis helioformis]|nr:Glycerophosphoryl diester phosphodiesterase family-domain-containing protein [Entophlyctis helioformis]